jgi:D-sedoheptulose 7-phosphate isomerase
MQRNERTAEAERQIAESISVKKLLLNGNGPGLIADCAVLVADALRKGNKLLICGNGGSAADAQHIAAEFAARFEKERAALPALALNANSSTLTAVGNDYSFDMVFARQIDALGQKGDVLLAISTSGNSENIRLAMDRAKVKGMKVIAFLGKDGGRCLPLADFPVVVPSERTSRIQEAHIMMGHILCSMVETELFPDE